MLWTEQYFGLLRFSRGQNEYFPLKSTTPDLPSHDTPAMRRLAFQQKVQKACHFRLFFIFVEISFQVPDTTERRERKESGIPITQDVKYVTSASLKMANHLVIDIRCALFSSFGSFLSLRQWLIFKKVFETGS